MGPVSQQRLQQNLARLCADPSLFGPTPHSKAMSEGLCLAHSTTDEKMVKVCESGFLKSMQALIDEKVCEYRPDCVEVLLGTLDSVFFYLGSFSIPHTNCGFLFSQTAEIAHPDASATPFDSGGLRKHFSWQGKSSGNESTTVRDFFDRHELPAPDHRKYLELSLTAMFDDPLHYLDPAATPRRESMCGLTGGDGLRRWTHEVRIPKRLELRGGHLVAVFAPRGKVGGQASILDLFEWCEEHGVERRFFDSPQGDEHNGLRDACLNYLRQELHWN